MNLKDVIILASASKQRKQILKDLNIPFMAVPSNIREDFGDLRDPKKIVKHLAFLKARFIANKHPNSWIIGCDTIVVLSDGTITGKPAGRKDAKKTLKQYSGSHADVYSGLALIKKSAKCEYIGEEKTRLYFHKFNDESIDKYLGLNRWQGSSGSMTIEGEGGKLIKKIEGEYWNVVGMPVNLLKKFLKKAKIG